MPWTPPPLETERLYLEAPEDGIQPAFTRDGPNAVEQNLPGTPSNWRIYLKGTDRPVGTIGFIRWEREAGIGEIGFIMMNIHTGKGYMTEACRAVLAFGFKGMGLDRVEAKSLPKNAASIRVLEKIGMQRKGTVQARLSSKGPLVDLELFSIGKGEEEG